MRRLLLLSLACLTATSLTATPASTALPTASPDLVLTENNGLVVGEAEQFVRQEHTGIRAWHRIDSKNAPDIAPDGDPSHADTASDHAYVECLPDTHRTHDDPLVPRENFSNETGTMAVLTYRIHFHTPGRYYSPAYFCITGKDRAQVQRGDFDLISLPTDFFGFNIYTGVFVRAGRRGRPERLPFPRGYPASENSWWLKLLPRAMYWGPRHVTDLYGPKAIYVTENGAGYDDEPPVNGEVLDLHRREYIRQCLVGLHRTIADGSPVRGYFLWSFMDNFELLDGYSRRFGICYTDYKTQKRTPKLSAHWYAEVMRQNRLV